MAYAAEFGSSDLTAAIIDGIATVGVALVGFGSLIGLVLLYRWFTGRKK